MSNTKWLPVATTARRDRRAPEQRESLDDRVAHRGGDRDPDRDREADVQARHGRELVVEARGQVGVHREAGLGRDRVDQAAVRQPRGRHREGGVDRDGEQPGGQDRVAQPVIERARAAVQENERAREHDQLGREIEVVEDPQRDGAVERALDRRLGGHAEVVLEIHDPVGVRLGAGEVADREPAGDAVDEVGEEEEADLRACPRGDGHAGHSPGSRCGEDGHSVKVKPRRRPHTGGSSRLAVGNSPRGVRASVPSAACHGRRRG